MLLRTTLYSERQLRKVLKIYEIGGFHEIEANILREEQTVPGDRIYGNSLAVTNAPMATCEQCGILSPNELNCPIGTCGSVR
jgi:hypothetical protein